MQYTLVQCVKVFEKHGALQHIGKLMLKAGFCKAFLVCDAGIVKLGITDTIQHLLEIENLDCVIYDKVVPDPPSEIIDEGSQTCRREGCDCVIAVGGGSSIDVAKGINILRFNAGRILDYATPEATMQTARGLIVIPTTSGTGSELSNGLIVSDVKNTTKVPILAVEGMSEYALLDSALTEGMPPELTLITGLDVFSHACEAYTTVLASPTTDMICEKIMETVVEFLPQAVAEGTNTEARKRMLASASLGGWMLACASAHVGHSMAHVLGAHYHIPHGKACAYSLPATIRFIASACPEKIQRVGRILGTSFSGSESHKQIGKTTAQAYLDFCGRLGLAPLTLQNLDENTLRGLAGRVAFEPLAALCPIPVTVENILPVLREILER